MTRRRYRWDIYCEKLFDRDYMTFFNEMIKIRPYFYPTSDIMKFADKDHSELDFDIEGKVPESARPYLIVTQSIILVY